MDSIVVYLLNSYLFTSLDRSFGSGVPTSSLIVSLYILTFYQRIFIFDSKLPNTFLFYKVSCSVCIYNVLCPIRSRPMAHLLNKDIVQVTTNCYRFLLVDISGKYEFLEISVSVESGQMEFLLYFLLNSCYIFAEIGTDSFAKIKI